MSLTIVPLRWYSWDFDVMEGTRHLARIDVSSWREKGVLTIDGADYRVYREGAMSGDFLLERDGLVFARATKPSAFKNTFVVTYHERQYTLSKRSAWRREFVVRSGETEIGSLAPTSAWRREAAVRLPEDWPIPIRVFVIWLAIILWKRDADAAAVAASV